MNCSMRPLYPVFMQIHDIAVSTIVAAQVVNTKSLMGYTEPLSKGE